MLEICRCCPSVKRTFFLGRYRTKAYLYYACPDKGIAEDRGWENEFFFLEGNSLLPPSQFSYRRGLGTLNDLLILSHHLHVALDRSMERKFVQLDFSAAFGKVSHRGMLYKLRSIQVLEDSYCS